MSYGLVICGVCKREVHQDGPDHSWRHCEDKTPICFGATTPYPRDSKEIVGEFCGADDFDNVFLNKSRSR